MGTNYDHIAEDYKKSKQVAWRHHIEEYSLRELLGDVTGCSVLDLACGDGHYTRLLKKWGASRVVGVDLSAKMIELAETAERADAAGIEYHVSDARNLRLSDQFDFVIAAYLLNYARSAEVLLEMAETIASNLKAGGRFITVNNNPRQRVASFASTRKYGFVKTTEGPIRNGSPIQFVFFNGENSFEVENYHLDADIHRAALTDAGFSDVQWHSPKLSLAEAVGPDPGAWSDFLEDPPVVLLTCTKAALRVAAAGASKQ